MEGGRERRKGGVDDTIKQTVTSRQSGGQHLSDRGQRWVAAPVLTRKKVNTEQEESDKFICML